MKFRYSYITAALLALLLAPITLQAQEPDEYEEVPAALLSAQGTIYSYRTEGEHETPKARELFFYGMRSYPFGKIPQNARLSALGQMEKMRGFNDGHSPLAATSWQQIGPYQVGGRVRSIAVHPTDGQTLWIGAADGGVWKSTDRGQSWEPTMDNTNAIAMGAVAVDPNNPDILYAGTGEMSSNVDAYTGAGIFKSEDGGITWRVLGLTNVGAFSRIIVHPGNSLTIWAAATKNNGGFYKSTDGGITWRRTLDLAVADITVNPQNPDQLWIGLMSNGIQASTDGGETFAARNNGLAPLGTTLNRMSVQVAYSNPSILYALGYETAGTTTFSRIYKSTNSGGSWTKIFDNQPNFLANSAASQGWYNNVIAVQPDDPNIVIAGGVTMVRTTNGGSSWSTAGANVHADHHAMAFDPANPSRLYEGNDGGMYRSENSGGSFTKISQGLAITQFYAMAIDQRQANLTYGGAQDNGTLTHFSADGGDVFGGDGFYVAVDHTVDDIIYIERENGQIYRIETGGAGGFYISNTIPVSATYVNWSAPLVLDPKDPNKLYSGRHKLYVNLNPRGAEDWYQVSPEMAGNISAIGISPINSDIIYIGSAQGVVQRTTNGTDSWENLTFGHGLPNRAVTDFAFSRTDPNTVYVSYSGFFTEHVYKTTDAGESWQSISRGLPDIPVNALALHPDDENIIFAGSDIGMFISIDGGATWTVYNEGFPRVAVVDLEIHEESATLRAATHGRSMFEIQIGGEGPEITPSITSPAGGEVWIGATPNVVSWGGFSDPVRLEYSLDDGANWRTLGEFISGSSFLWNVVNKPSIVARVRVTSMADPSRSVVSNTFTITPFGQGAVLYTDSKPIVPYGIAYDGEFLWATDFGGSKLLKLDPTTLNAVAEVQIQGNPADELDSLFTDITYCPPRGTFFIHRLYTTVPPLRGGMLLEVAKDGAVLGKWASPCTYPIGLAWLGAKNQDIQYLFASDRDGAQTMYFFDLDGLDRSQSAVAPAFTYARARMVEGGPRGATADEGTFWQVMTDFTGGSLQSAWVQSIGIEDVQQNPVCLVPLSSPLSTSINARGVELDVKDKGMWITDYSGNLYKIATCYTLPGESDSGTVRTSVEAGPVVVEGVELASNKPNPFSDATEISFTLPAAMSVQLFVHDMNGRIVAKPASGRFEGGTHRVRFSPKGLPAGAYRYTLTLENGTQLSRTMMYLK